MPMRLSPEYESDGQSALDLESGYASGSSSQESALGISFTKSHLAFLNRQLQTLEPQGGRIQSTMGCGHVLTASSFRDLTMVHNIATVVVPDDIFWSHRVGNPRHAIEDEERPTAAS